MKASSIEVRFYVLGDVIPSRHGTEGGETAMKFQEIRNMAKGMGVTKYNNMKKVDLIRAIQKAENNIDCYGTQRVDSCQEETCLWRSDCLALNSA